MMSRHIKNFSFLVAVLLFTAGGVYAVNAALTFSSTSVVSEGALTLTGAGASTWDIGANTLSLQKTNNGPITTGTGLFTMGGNLTLSGTGALINVTADESGQTAIAGGVGTIDVNMQTRTAKIPLTFTVGNDFSIADGANRNVGKKIYDFPSGNIVIRSITIDITDSDTTAMSTTYRVGIGSSGTTGTDSNLSGTLSDMFSGGGTLNAGTNQTFFTAGSASQSTSLSTPDAYFNVGVSDSSTSGAATIDIVGTLLISYDVY